MNLNNNERLDDLCINNLKLIQNNNYFCFGTDSVVLANFAKSNNANNTILDLCSGSGIIPIVFSTRNKYKNITCIELQNEMFELLDKNIKLNNLNFNIFKSDICDYNKIQKYLKDTINNTEVDIITINPPYKSKNTGIKNELDVKYIARHEVLCTLDDIFKTSYKLLKDKGKLYMVHKPERISDLINIARKYNLEIKKIQYVYPNILSKPSIILLEYSKNGGNEVLHLPPIIQYDLNNKETKEFLEFVGMSDYNE